MGVGIRRHHWSVSGGAAVKVPAIHRSCPGTARLKGPRYAWALSCTQRTRRPRCSVEPHSLPESTVITRSYSPASLRTSFRSKAPSPDVESVVQARSPGLCWAAIGTATNASQSVVTRVCIGISWYPLRRSTPLLLARRRGPAEPHPPPYLVSQEAKCSHAGFPATQIAT